MQIKSDTVYDFSTSDIDLPSWWGDTDKDFGHYSEDGREYVITSHQTPRPWLNYLGNDCYGLVFGNHGEGFSWYRSMTARVTKYTSSEYVPRTPDSGRVIYLREHAEKEMNSIAHCQASESYECIHGLGYTTIKNEIRGIKSSWNVFVPYDDPVEIWRLTLKNTNDRVKEFQVIPMLEWQLGQYVYSPPCKYQPVTDIDKDLEAFFLSDQNCFVVENTQNQPLRYKGFFKSYEEVDAWQCKRNSIGGGIVGLKDINLTNESAGNEPVVSALSVNVVLKPGEQKQLVFVGGVWHDEGQLQSLLEKYATKENVENAFSQLADYWNSIINDTVYITTPNEEVDLWCNIRLKHLNHQTMRWTRGLDRGYRDILQDLRGFVGFDSELVKRYILKTLSYQYSDGRAVRQWSEVTQFHDLRDYSDSPLWLPDVLAAYIKETGDFNILDEQVDYFDHGSASVYEHLLQGLWSLFLNRGSHGLCLIRYGDWNDALEGIGKEGKAQGVWLSMALYWAMDITKDLARRINDQACNEKLLDAMECLKNKINQHGWMGNWYAYAIDDEGGFVGSPNDAEGQIHLNAQTFAIFTGIASGEKKQKCREVIENTLMTDVGPLLVSPSYKKLKVGRIWRMEPGTFENGSMYFHGAAFKIMADLVSREPDAALDTFLKILPSNPANPPARSTIEPYALGNYYCGRDNEFFGLNIYSHFTGSYPWLSKAIIEKMVGIEADCNGLKITPNFPLKWNNVKVKRKFRDSNYDIEISRNKCDMMKYDVLLNGNLIAEHVESSFIELV